MVRNRICGTLLALAAAGFVACSGDSVTGPGPGQGMLAVRLTDAPAVLDSLAAVNVHVVRVDARRSRAELPSELNADINRERGDNNGWAWGHRDSTKWVTIAEPDSAFDLLALQGGVSAFLGASPVDTGHFKAVRIVIDPAQSSIVLKDGTVLTPDSDPPVEFESRGRHGLFVELDSDVAVESGTTTTLTLDIRLASSITLRGITVRHGFLFRPVVIGRCERNR